MFRRLPYCAVPGYAPICCDSNDPDTVLCSFAQRLLRTIPVARPDCLERFGKFVHDFCRKNVPRVHVLTFEGWLTSTNYSIERKDELRRAYADLRGGRPTTHQAQKISSFVKSESYPTWKHARMINSRSDSFKVFSGPMFKAIEDAIYGLKEFIKHVPVSSRPSLIASMRKAGVFYYATDFTAFESHFTPEFLNVCECELYRWCLGDTADCQFLCETLMGPNRMRTRSGVSAKVFGRRMSGDMCTSLGNGFTNLILAKFIAFEKGGELEGYVEGDDGLFSSTVPLEKDDYLDLGFTIKIERVEDPCLASFCGLIFADSGQIVRNPFRFLMNFGWTSSFINSNTPVLLSLLRAKALSTIYETPNCPIVGAMARYAEQITRGVLPRFVADGYHVPHDVVACPEFCPSADTCFIFECQYGISIELQLLCEKAIAHGDMSRLAQLLPAPAESQAFCSAYVLLS